MMNGESGERVKGIPFTLARRGWGGGGIRVISNCSNKNATKLIDIEKKPTCPQGNIFCVTLLPWTVVWMEYAFDVRCLIQVFPYPYHRLLGCRNNWQSLQEKEH